MTFDLPLVSVIIVNYNKKNYLDKCLSSLSTQTYRPLEVILVDNGSADGSVDFTRENFPRTRILRMRENVGFAKANNAGIAAAKGRLIATLNNDTEVMPGWTSEMVRGIASDDRIGMCASKMLFMDTPGIINSTGVMVSRSGACWDRGMSEPDVGQYESEEEVFGPCAGAAMYRREMLEEAGAFDEDFVAYMEDADLAFRGRMAGWKCLYVPRAVVYHKGSGTAGYMSDYSIYYGNRNIIWNYIKNYRGLLFVTCLPWAVCRNLAVIPYYAVKGFGVTIVRSKVDAIKLLPRMMIKRWYNRPASADVKRYLHTWAAIPSPIEKKGTPAR